MGKMTELLYAAAARSLTRWNAAPQPSAARPSGAPAQASSLPFKRKLLLEALEPRLLLSADLLPVNVPVVTAVVAASRPWMDARAAAADATPEVRLTTAAAAATQPLQLTAVGPIEGGARLAQTQAGSFSSAPEDLPGSVSYAVNLAQGQLLSVVATFDNRGWSAFYGRLQVIAPDGESVVDEVAGQAVLQLQAIAAPVDGAYQIVLTAQRDDTPGEGHPGTLPWVLHAAVDAVLETEDLFAGAASNDQISQAEWLDGFRVLPLPGAERTAVVGRLTPQNNDGRSATDVYAITLAEGETLEVITTLSGQHGYLQLLDGQGRQVAAATRVGAGQSWDGPIGLPTFVADVAGTYYLRTDLYWDSARSLDPIEYTLVAARGVSLDPDSSDELGLAPAQLAAVVHPIVATSSALVPQAVGPQSAAQFEATATAETVRIEVTPVIDPSLASSDWLPTLTVLDGNGQVLVATPVDSSGWSWEVTATVGDRLWLEINTDVDAQFLLVLVGAQGENPAPAPTSSSLDDGRVAGSSPWQWIRFNEAVRADRLQAGELFDADGNSLGAVNLSAWSNDAGVSIQLASNLPEGDYTLVLADGAVEDLTGQGSARIEYAFSVDNRAPTLASRNPPDQGELAADQRISLVFSEPMSGNWPSANFYNDAGEVIYPGWSPTWSQDGRTLTIDIYGTLAEGSYELRFEEWVFQDLAGNAFDADPATATRDPLVLRFSTDTAVSVLPALAAREPFGALIYTSGRNAALVSDGDTDEFQIDLQAGQTFDAVLSAALGQSIATLPQLALQVVDPNGDVVAESASTQAGRPLLIPSIVVGTSGTWALRVSSPNGEMGNYSAAVVVGADVQRESVEIDGVLQPGNHTRATAEDLDRSSLVLADGIDRLASVGRFSPGFDSGAGTVISDWDFFRFTLDAGQTATVVVAVEGSAPVSNLRLGLFDDSGDLVTGVGTLVGAAIATPEADRAILDFTNHGDSAVTLYARPRADSSVRYSMVVTRGATFDVGAVNGLPQGLGPTGAVLGGFDDQASTGVAGGVVGIDGEYSTSMYTIDGGGHPWSIDSYGQIVNDEGSGAFDSGNYLQLDGADGYGGSLSFQAYGGAISGDGRTLALDGSQGNNWQMNRKVFVPGDDGFIRYLDQITNLDSTSRTITLRLDSDLGSDNWTQLVATDAGESQQFDPQDHWLVTDDSGDPNGSDPALAHVLWGDGGLAPGLAQLSGDYLQRSWTVTVRPGETVGLLHFAVQAADAEQAQATAQRLLALPSEAVQGLLPAELASIVNFNTGQAESYRFWANDGDSLSLGVQAMADAGLPFALRLFDPYGNLRLDTGTAEGAYAGLSTGYTADITGAWLVQLLSAGAQGEYLLQVDGATGAPPAPQIVGSQPSDTRPLGSAPTSIDVSFDQFIRPDTVQATDLQLDESLLAAGVSVTGVEVLSGTSVRFRLSAADLPEGYFGWTIDAGAVLGHDGQGNDWGSGAFEIDRTGPQVLDHGGTERRSQFNSLVFSFNEDIDAASVSVADIASFTGPNGNDLRNNLYSVQVSGSQVTVWFYSQSLPGDYTMVLGPDVRDLAGNALDQDGDGTPGEAEDDRYTALVTVADADLVVTAVTAPTEAEAGQQITVQWTVRNDGERDSTPGRGWYDLVRLIDADGGVPFSTYVYRSQSLAVGESYEQSLTFMVPLSNDLLADDYQVEVWADGFSYLTELDNNNNTLRAVAPLTISLPPVADLVIAEVIVPSAMTTNAGHEVSWQLLNQGEGTSTYSYSLVELVDLDGNLVYINYEDSEGGSYSYLAYSESVWNGDDIDPAGSVLQQVNVYLPSELPPGQYRLRITADAYDYVTELDGESNNAVLSDAFSVSQVDLRVVSVTAPASVTMGDVLNVSWEVANDGPAALFDGYYYERVELIDDATDEVAYSWEESRYGINLGEGETYTASASFTVPYIEALASGNYRVRVIVDSYQYIGEGDEANNTLDATELLTIVVPDVPDLVASQITVPAEVAGNTSLTVAWTTLNQGAAATDRSFRDQLYLESADGALSHLGTVWYYDAIAASGSVQRSASFVVPHTLVPGSYQVRIQTDDGGNINELAGESNNISRSEALSVTTAIVADLAVQSITPPQGVVLGQPVTVSWVGVNQGNGATSSAWYDVVELIDANGSIRQSTYTYINPGNLAAGATYNGTLTFTPPISASLPEGEYRIRVRADGYGYQLESNDNNNQLQTDGSFPLVAPATPDLVVEAIQVPADSAPANTRITLVWDEVNQGDAASASTTTSYVELINAGNGRVFSQVVSHSAPSSLDVGGRVQRSLDLVLPAGLVPGAYRARITTDYYGQVPEYTGDNNNVSISAAFTVTEAIRADLSNVRLNTALSDPATFGTTLRVDYSVDNEGPGSTQNVTWTDRVQLVRISDDAVVVSANVAAGSASGVAAGNSYSRVVDLALPIVGTWASGDYRVRIIADVNGNLSESDRADNTLLSDLRVNTPPLANLVVADVAVDPADATAGREITVSWTDRNIGDGSQLPRYGASYNYFHDRVYLADSAGNVLRTLGDYILQVAVAPGAEVARVQQLTLPDDVVDGNYTIVVQTDINDYINEHAGESDNRSTSAVFSVTQPPRVDLQAASVVLPAAEATTGAPITVQWLTRNAGEADFAGSFNEVVQISTTADFSLDVRVLSPVSRFSGTLAAGAEVQRTAEVQVPVDLNGSTEISRTWYVRVVSDNNNEVYEYTFENNNASSAASIVFSRPALPDLQVDLVDAPAAAQAGTEVVVSYTVTNHGTADAGPRTDRIVLLREDGSLWSIDAYLRSDEVLAAGASQQLQARITLPVNSGNAGYSGRLRAQVSTDWNGEVLEYPNDGNNTRSDTDLLVVTLPPLPNLALSQIVLPAEALTEADVPLRWTVSNTGDAATAGGWTDRVYLTRNGTLSGDYRQLANFSIDTSLAAGAAIERVQTITLPRDTTGEWQIVIVTDVDRQVFEGVNGENDNQLADADTISLVQRPLPNLVVDSVTPPQNAFSSQPVTVRWTVRNTGTGTTTVPSWRDAVYLSTDDIFDGSDVYLGATENPGYLEVGGDYASSLTATLPRGISGPYRFFVVTDFQHQLYEGNAASGAEADNTSAPALATVTLTPPPDLVVRNIVAPLQVFSGESISVSWEVLNDDADGRTRETGWYDRVWMSTDTTLDGADTYLGEVRHTGALDALESYIGNLTAALPIGVTGAFHVIVAADVYDQVYENNRDGNNTGVRQTATTIDLTPPPDLEIVDVDLPATARAGTELTVRFRVENLGASDVPARQSWWSDAAWLSLDDTIDPSDLALGSVTHYGVLATDAGYDATLRFTLPAGLAERDDYQLILRTDQYNQVFEAPQGDANNTVVLGPIAVFQSRPDLVVSAFTMPAEVEAGRTATFQWTVSNLGNGDSIAASWTDSLWVSLDNEIGDGDDVLIGNVGHAGVLASQASYDVTVAPVLPFALVGTGRFYVRTDGGGQVAESNDANNLSDVLTVVIQRQESDLQVSDAQVTPVEGDARSFDVQFVVTNTGVAGTNVNAWVDGIWLSADNAVGAGDTRVRTVARNNPLAAGDSYTVSTRVTVPDSVSAGSFKVLVRADDNNAVIEGAGEGNNTAVATVTIGGLPAPDGQLPVGEQVVLHPDLTVVSVQPPADAFSGQAVTIRWTVRNQGIDDASSPYWWWSAYDQVYLSEDAFLDNGDISLGYTSYTNQAAGTDMERSLTANLPVGRSGLFYVLVKADAGNRFAEPDAEGNNLGQSSTLFQIDLAPPADLVAGTVQVPDEAVLGASMAVTYTVTNASSFAALGSWRDVLYLSTDDVFDTGDIYFGAADAYGPVAGGASYSRTVNASLPGVNPGAYKLIVRSDVRNVITELSEANNLSASIDAVELDVPELTLGTAVAGSFAGGQPLYFKVRVAAGEALRFTLDGPGEDVAHDLFVGFNSVPSRSFNQAGTGELFTPDPVVTIPSTEAGVYYLRVDPSPQGAGAFSLVANLVPFSVDRVRETTVGNTGEATVRVDGTLFTDDTRFELVGADGARYGAVALSLRDAGRAYVTFDLFGAAPGTFDLQATRPSAAGGELVASLDAAMQVTDGEGADAFLTITGPTAVQVNRDATFKLNYSNDGDADTMAPLMILSPSAGTSIGLSSKSLTFQPLFILGAALDGPLDVLRPGAMYSLPVAYKTPGEAGYLSIEARPVQGDSTEQITDWSMIEGALRPADVDFAAWQQFWGRVQPRIGNTMGDLVGVLNDMAVRLSPAGDPIRDVRALFAAQMAADANWTPSQQVAGVLLGSGSGAAQAGVEVQVAYMQGERLRVEASTVSAADGSFSFSRVRAGDYFLMVGGRQFDLDRDGQPDQSAPQLTVSNNAPLLVDTLYLFDEGLGDEIDREDSRTELLTDTQGVVHAFWQRGDRLYHAYRDATGAWQDARALSDGVPGEVAVAAGSAFVGGEAGLIAVWSEGVDNDSELFYAVARARADGGYEWSDPVRLTTNTVADVAPDVVVDGDGQAVITFLRRDFTIQDDSDLYYVVVDPDTLPLVWNDAVTFNAQVQDDAALAAAGELDPQLSSTYRFGYSKDLGEWTIAGFYVKAGFEGTLVASLDDQACETTVGGQVKGTAEIKVANKGKVAGEASLAANAKWTVDPNTQDWKFAGASADFAGSVKYVWRDGIYDVMAAFPTLAPIAQLLRQGQNFINKASGGAVRIQNGINIGPLGVEFKGMKWSADAPFPNFFMPQTLDSAAVSGSLGLWARAYSSYWGGIDLSLEGSIGFKATVYPSFKLEGTAQAAVTGKVGGWTIFNGEWQGSATLVEGAELSAQANDPAPFLMLRWDPEATLGTTNVYGTGAVDAQVASNRLGDSPMVLARNADGSVSGLFARDADATAGEIGTELFVTDLGAGGWSDEVAIDGSLGFNGDGKLVTLADGRRVAVWTHASTAALTSASTMEQIFAARDANDVYYAIDGGSGFGTPIRLAGTAGTDADLDVTTLVDGTVAVAWTSTGADGTATLLSAIIDAAGAAGTPIEVASGLLSNVSVTGAGNELLFSWDLDTDATEDGTAFEVHTAALVDGVLTGGGFEVTPLTAEFAKVIGTSTEAAASGQLSAQGLFPPFAVPEDCKKCTPEKLKKIPEAAPDCRPGGGTSAGAIDTKKCEQKIITYAPCVTRPSDPNDIVGPDSYGDEHWIKASEALPYTIRFENQASATAPAQVVTITQTLDADLDARSFRITGFGFADVRVEPSESRSFYSGRLDLRDSQGIFLDVSARIDTTTREITWTFTTIDPATGEVPVSSDLGFLLPNDESGRGDGWVSYTVKPVRSPDTGTVIDAQARIVFDSEGPIDTPAIFHTLDAGVPTSAVEALPETVDATTFTVRWSGTDAEGGSAVRDYEVYVSIDGGEWRLWQLATADTEAVYEGEPGHTYAFYSVARDNAGNIEAAPSVADAQIRVLAQTGSVAGAVFNDIDGDGQRGEGEGALAGWTVYLDADTDGLFDEGEISVTSDAEGNWLFADLQPQVVRVALVVPAGHEVTTPLAGYHDVAVAAGDALAGRNFGVLELGSIAGVQFDDLNGNGQQDAGETGLANWTIFIDADGDGQHDDGERHTVTADDGSYAFADLRPGAYVIAQVMQDGWIQTRPGTASANGQTAFAVTLSGSLASISLPACACGGTVTTVAAQQSGWDEQLVDLDAMRADPGYAGVDGSGVRVVVIDTGIDATHPFFEGRIVYQYDFADNDSQAIDRNGHGTHVAGVIAGADAMFGGVAQGAELIVLKVFGDDGSGSFRNLERALQWVNNNAEAYNIGVVNLSLGDGGNWTDAGSRYGLGDEFAALAARGIINVAAAGNNYAAVNALGVAYPGSDPAVLAVGAVWTGDFGGPWKFGNGGVDEATGEDRIASFSQRDPDQIDTFAPGARLTSAAVGGGVRTMQGTSQSAAYVSGVAALAQQLAQQHLGRSLTVAEFRELLVSTAVGINDGDDEHDNVANSGLDFPRLDVKAMADAILAMGGASQPGGGTGGGGTDEPGNPTPVGPAAGGGSLSVDLVAGQHVDDADFGVFQLGQVSGRVYADLNGNGQRDDGEAGIAGATVFVDVNGNGMADEGETTVTTDADGGWQLGNLLPGSLTVGETLPAGWARDGAGSYSVSVTSGLNETTLDFGRHDIAPDAQDDVASTVQGRSVSGQVLANDSDPGRPDNSLLLVSLVSGPAHGALTLGEDGAFTYTPTAGFEGADSFRYAVSDGVSSREAVVHLTVAHDVLVVDQLSGRHDGFDVSFSRAISLTGLDVGGANADVVVTNAAGLPVAGSLFVAADGRSARFIASGSLLADGVYSVRLRAGEQALRDLEGVALNGAADPVNGSDHVGQFTVARNNALSVGVADTVRGPGQVLGVALKDTGLAVRLSNGAGVTELRFTLAYDPALLGVATLTRGAGLPATAGFSVTDLGAGRLAVVITAAGGLPTGALTVALLGATVPTGAAYGAAQVIDVRDLVVNNGALAALDDDGVHVAAYPGDMDGDRLRSAADVALMRGLLDGSVARLAQLPLLDGRLLGDVNGSGRFDAVDPLRLTQALAGTTGVVLPIPGATPAPVAPPVIVVTVPPKPVVPRVVPKATLTPSWVAPLVSPSATISANASIRVTL
ncbi:MAG: hypothetical protein A3E25_16225 [Burkholderiales bacterium RIFCSPHIGHO2_12_FULL_69_20]|nr:MAG: hypothetical protein A3E25_16225 [Burkholderiales bacterium RIFCSPHIGHO2_12_FULL_69_20]